MTPKRSHLGLGRQLRLERFEPRQMLSAAPVETPTEFTLHSPTLLLNDSLIASSGLANGWTLVSDDSSLSFIDAWDTPIAFNGADTNSAFGRLSIGDSIADADSLSLDLRSQDSNGKRAAFESRLERVVEILVEKTTPTPTPTVTPNPTAILEPATPVPAVKAEPAPRLDPGASAQPEWQRVDPTPEPTSSPVARVAVVSDRDIATPADDPVNDALTQSIVTAVAGDTELTTETPETDPVNDASFLPLEERQEQKEATSSPFEPNEEPQQAPIIDRQLERLATDVAPPAGAKQPGAGLLDLTALLLDPADPHQTAQAAPPRQPEAEARDAALAVESWVRPLPAGGMMPVNTSPPTPGVQAQRPSTGLVPMEDLTSPSEEEKPLIRSVSAAKEPSERVATPARSVGPFQFAAVVVSTLLGGSVVWTSQRRGPSDTPDCFERPRRGRK